jgi:electron transfer flavoprotein alpha/beta subunit
VERASPRGYDVLEAPTPCVVTTGYEVGALREPGVEAFMSAGSKPLTVWNAQALGLEPGKTSYTRFIKMYQPTHDIKCEMIDGVGPEAKAVNLVTKLKDIKAI